ncbi:MAG: hydroxyacid dehydrogenase [Candidatus Micrarchaeota archaeon]|nr:hydroxyacid dehydrogenase [Candidatus Micrarchaeota archaeon]
MAKIVHFELEKWEYKYLASKLSHHEMTCIDGHLSSSNISQAFDAEILSVFIYSKIGKKELDLLPNLKMIATRSTGFDHIDVAECSSRGIVVSNVPEYGSKTVAEHTLALILAISKKLIPSVERTRRGDFSLNGLRGFDLEGKTLGIIGFGRIGQHTAKLAKAFGMNVIAYSPHIDSAIASKLGCKPVSLDELLASSDIISLHAPLTKETYHMINSETIKKMKDGTILINTARGGLVDAKALVAALDSGKIAAAGLDVLEEECNIKEEAQLLSPHFAGECDLKTVLANHILLNRQNVIVTPHNAFNSTEALQRILDTTAQNIASFLNGQPINVVSAPKSAV